MFEKIISLSTRHYNLYRDKKKPDFATVKILIKSLHNESRVDVFVDKTHSLLKQSYDLLICLTKVHILLPL